jgi:hypothetical protein
MHLAFTALEWLQGIILWLIGFFIFALGRPR